MSNDTALREHVLALLEKDQAHAGFEKAVANMPFELQGKRPEGAAHSPWQTLEHLRIAQWDILEFSRDPHHVSPKFPKGYWPKPKELGTQALWQKTVDEFRNDLQQMAALVEDEATDLYAKIPHGSGQTILREALLIADHNAYHLGALAVMSRIVKTVPQ